MKRPGGRPRPFLTPRPSGPSAEQIFSQPHQGTLAGAVARVQRRDVSAITAKNRGLQLASPRDHEQVASAIAQCVMWRHPTEDRPHHLAARVLDSLPNHVGKLFRPDDIFDQVTNFGTAGQRKAAQEYGHEKVNDVLDHVFHMSGEMRQPPPPDMERIGDRSREHAASLLDRVRQYQRGEDVKEGLADSLIDAHLAGANLTEVIDAITEAPPPQPLGITGGLRRGGLGSVESQREIKSVVRHGRPEFHDPSFGAAERRNRIRAHIQQQAPANRTTEEPEEPLTNRDVMNSDPGVTT